MSYEECAAGKPLKEAAVRAADTSAQEAEVDAWQWLGNTLDAVWVTDSEQRIVLWNDAAEELFRFPRSKALGKLCHDVMRSQDKFGNAVCHKDCRYVMAASRRKPVKHSTLSMSTGNGQLVPVDVTFAWKAEDGQHVDLLAHFCRPLGDTTVQGAASAKDTAGHGLEAYVLGPFRCYRGGELVSDAEWGRRKVKALFKYLLSQRNKWVTREEVVDLLWPNMEPVRALNNLRVTLCRLRRILEPHLSLRGQSTYLQVQQGMLRLKAEPALWLDVAEFEELLRGIHSFNGDRWAPERIQRLERAVALYQGEYLQDNVYDEWTDLERQRLVHLYMEALEEVADYHTFKGNHPSAVKYRLTLLEQEPWREGTHHKLMLDYVKAGRYKEALHQYEVLKGILATHLNLQPSADITRLYQKLIETAQTPGSPDQ